MSNEDHLWLKCKIWHYNPDTPGIATSSDGEVMLYDEHARVVMPAPAAEILERISVRRAVR